MSNYHCYLCASDEGLLLDIFGDGGKAICRKIETCLSVKIEESDALSTKICHKCAYELDACSKFVEKCRRVRDGTEGKTNPVKGHCSLCSEPGKKGYIFDFKDGSPVNNSLHKIHEIFNDSIFKDKRRNLSICLDCRYNSDVLYDLKCIYQSTPSKLKSLKEKELQLSELPKTKTRVVSRNTTYIPVPRLNGVEISDTDSSSVSVTMPLKRKRGRPSKNVAVPVLPSTFRTCEQCENSVANGHDMYKYHRTGLTVCKECWLSMDPEIVALNKRKKLGLASGDVGTRKCAIILKDVLSNPAKYENIYKVEKDEHGNTTFIITDDSSESEERELATRSRRSRESATSVETTPSRRTRPAKRLAGTKLIDMDYVPPAKIKEKVKKIENDNDDKPSTSAITRTRNGLATSDTEAIVSRTRRVSAAHSAYSERNAKAASDAEATKPQQRKRNARTKFEKSEPADSPTKATKTATPTTRARRATKTVAAPIVTTSNQAGQSVRRTRANSFSSQDATSLSSRLSTRNAKSVSETGSPPTKNKRTKTKSLSPKNSGSELELENPYTCTVCRAEYRNKLIGMKHELTHAKQPEVKLQRVAMPEVIVEEEATAESSLIEEPEEQSHDVTSTSDHRTDEPESVEASHTAIPDKKASSDVLKETNEEGKEHLKESTSLPIADENKHEDEEKIEVKVDNEDSAEDKIDTSEAAEPETTVEIKKLDESNADDAREDETNDNSAIAESDKINDDKETVVSEKETKISDKETEISDKETKISDKETKISDEETKISDEERKIIVEVAKISDKETIISDRETKINDNETEVREKDEEEVVNTEKAEATPSEEVAKEVESAESLEEPSQQVLPESAPTSANVNGTTAEDVANTEVNEANRTEKEAEALDADAESKTVDLSTTEISENPENVSSVTSTAHETQSADKDVVKENALLDDETTEEPKAEADTASAEVPAARESETTKEIEESELVASDVVTEVFDLATAEVQKRLEKETPRDDKCTSPVAETLENISREICNSADMPSLEPLVDDQSGNNQS